MPSSKGQWTISSLDSMGVVSSGTITGDNTAEWTWPLNLGEDSVVDPRFLTCVVCGESKEDIFILCAMCRETIVFARKMWLRQMMRDMNEERETMEPVKYHCGYTHNGKLEHAVGFFGRQGGHSHRAACGVRIIETKQRIFGKNDDACKRCLNSSRV